MKRTLWIKIVIGLILVCTNISCDQLTKKHVRKTIATNEHIEVINHNFVLTKIENTGAALSFGQHFSPVIKLFIFKLIPMLVLIALFYYAIQKTENKVRFLAFTCIIGGGIGNIIDRVLYNSVTDFMYLEVGPLHTGIFNMADVSVTLGGILLLFNWFYTSKKDIIAS